ncbi:MAG: hypothetical protein WBB02_05395 [Saprospiraceae bacterium]
MCKIIILSAFVDNFLWPLMVATVIAIGGLLWNFFITKKLKLQINYSNSFIARQNDHCYAIINISLSNNNKEAVNNLIINTIPAYTFLNGIFNMTSSGRQPSGAIILPAAINLIQNVIIGNQSRNIGAESILEDNLIVDIVSHRNELNKIIINYPNNSIQKRVEFSKLLIREV